MGVVIGLLIGVALARQGFAQAPTPTQNRAADIIRLASAFPFRLDDTNVVNLHPLINYYSVLDATGIPRMTNRPLQDWELIQGRILQPAGSGLIVETYDALDWFQRRTSKQVRLVNHPNLSRLPPDGSVAAFAQFKKKVNFVDNVGVTNVVDEYDCGAPLKGAQLQQAEKEWQAYIRARQEMQKETLARIAKEKSTALAEQKAKRDAEQNRKAFDFYLKKATTGDVIAQYRLGEFYLTGRGTTTNIEAARLWLTAARTNGSAEADAKLKSLDKKE